MYIDQLPTTLDTLWLRLLGRDQVQQQAIADLLALPSGDPNRERVLQLLISWRVTLEAALATLLPSLSQQSELEVWLDR